MNVTKIILYLLIFLVVITFINTNNIEKFFADNGPVINYETPIQSLIKHKYTATRIQPTEYIPTDATVYSTIIKTTDTININVKKSDYKPTVDVTTTDEKVTPTEYTIVVKSITVPIIDIPKYEKPDGAPTGTPKLYSYVIETTAPPEISMLDYDKLTTVNTTKNEKVTPPVYTIVIKSITIPNIYIPKYKKPTVTIPTVATPTVATPDKLLEQITTQITNETQKIVSKLADIQDIISKSPGEKVDTSMIDKIQTIVTKSMGNIDANLNNIEILNKTIMNLITDNVSEQRMIGGMNILLGIGILIILMKKNI